MEFPNGDNVVASNLIKVNIFFFENCEIEFKNKDLMLFFLKDTMIAQKTKILILFTSQINIEGIKDSHIDMDLFQKKRKIQ
jgi:hypothetical protein